MEHFVSRTDLLNQCSTLSVNHIGASAALLWNNINLAEAQGVDPP